MKRRTRSTTTAGSCPDWNEFTDSMEKHRVRYVVVGAHALAIHGKPRHTGDLDVFVDPTPANAKRLAKALRAFGFAGYAGEAHQLGSKGKRGKMMTIGREPVRVDIMNNISGVSFAEAWRGRTRKRFGKKRVSFLGRRQYVKNKRASSKNKERRAKDLADLALMAEARPKKRKKKFGRSAKGYGRR